MKLSGVIFDLDGTLGETIPVCIAAFETTFEIHGGPSLSPAEIRALFGPNEHGVLRQALGAEWEPAVATYETEYARLHYLCPQPFPGIREMLNGLRVCGAELAVVTGKAEETAHITLETFELAAYFDVVAGGSNERVVKAERIRDIATGWKLPLDEVAYVGDFPVDIDQAREAGVAAVAAAWSEHVDSAELATRQPDRLFESVPEFATWATAAACGAATVGV